jgi:hypothetical protein
MLGVPDFINEKTFIGKIAKGFDFCGFRLSYRTSANSDKFDLD